MVPPRAMRSARSVAGRPGPGVHRARSEAWKNRAIACCTVVVVFPAVRSSPCNAPCSRPCQNGAACGWVRRISSGVVAPRGLATHSRTSSMLPAGQGGRVEVRLQHLRALGGVEPGRRVPGALGDRTPDGAGGERLRAAFGDHRVHTPVDRVPHQLRQPRRQTERVQHRHRTTTRLPVAASRTVVDGQQQVLGLGQRDQRRARCGQQRRSEQVEGLPGSLWPVHAGRPVERHPQVPGSRDRPGPEPPPHLGRGEPRMGLPAGIAGEVGEDDGLMHRTVGRALLSLASRPAESDPVHPRRRDAGIDSVGDRRGVGSAD